MKDEEEKESKKELEGLLEREELFLGFLRQLQGITTRVFARPEALDELMGEMKACETEIVKRYFFPIDKTIELLATPHPTFREELTKTSEEDRKKLLLFIDTLYKEVTEKEEAIKEFKEETEKLLVMLTHKNVSR